MLDANNMSSTDRETASGLENAAGKEFTQGTQVCDAGGEMIGIVKESNPQQGYMVVQKGWLFPEDVRVPMDAIKDTSATGIYLDGYKDELLQRDWAGATGGTGASGTDVAQTPSASGQTTTFGGASSAGVGTGAAGTGAAEATTFVAGERGVTGTGGDTASGYDRGTTTDMPATGSSARYGAMRGDQQDPTATTSATADMDMADMQVPGAGMGTGGMMNASTVTEPEPIPGEYADSGAPMMADSGSMTDTTVSSRQTQTITKYLGDMHALESHILQALDRQVRLLQDHAETRRKIRVYRNTIEEHLDALQDRLQTLGGSPTHPIKEAVASVLGVAAGLYDKVRNEEASKDLRDDYTALNHSVIAYIMLHTTAAALGDQETADLCRRHLMDNARFVMEINHDMPALVLEELRQDGLPVAESTSGTAQQTVHDIWQQPPHTRS